MEGERSGDQRRREGDVEGPPCLAAILSPVVTLVSGQSEGLSDMYQSHPLELEDSHYAHIMIVEWVLYDHGHIARGYPIRRIPRLSLVLRHV